MTSAKVLRLFFALSAACAAKASPEFAELIGDDQPQAPKLVEPGAKRRASRKKRRRARKEAP